MTSEQNLATELDLSRCTRIANLAECGCVHRGTWVGVVGDIECIGSLSAELELHPISDTKGSSQIEVDCMGCWSAKKVTWRITIHRFAADNRVLRKSCGIKPLI